MTALSRVGWLAYQGPFPLFELFKRTPEAASSIDPARSYHLAAMCENALSVNQRVFRENLPEGGKNYQLSPPLRIDTTQREVLRLNAAGDIWISLKQEPNSLRLIANGEILLEAGSKRCKGLDHSLATAVKGLLKHCERHATGHSVRKSTEEQIPVSALDLMIGVNGIAGRDMQGFTLQQAERGRLLDLIGRFEKAAIAIGVPFRPTPGLINDKADNTFLGEAARTTCAALINSFRTLDLSNALPTQRLMVLEAEAGSRLSAEFLQRALYGHNERRESQYGESWQLLVESVSGMLSWMEKNAGTLRDILKNAR